MFSALFSIKTDVGTKTKICRSSTALLNARELTAHWIGAISHFVHAVEELQNIAAFGVMPFMFTAGLEIRPEKV